MSDHILGDRRKTLEERFFAKQNEELRRSLQEKEANRERKEALAEASGIRDDAVLERLVALDFGVETVAALSLVPLAEVAWADGQMDDREREAILAGARESGMPEGGACQELLESWLRERPGRALLEAWQSYVEALCQKLSAVERVALRDELLGRARAVAEAAGGFLGLGSKVSPAERHVLDLLEKAFD